MTQLLKPNAVHPALVAALNDFDPKIVEAKLKSFRGFAGDFVFFGQMVLAPTNATSLLFQVFAPSTVITPVVIVLNVLALSAFGLQVAMWRSRMASLNTPDALHKAQTALRALIVKKNNKTPSLQPIFQDLEPTIANGDIVWVAHVHRVLSAYDAQSHHTTMREYEKIVSLDNHEVNTAPITLAQRLEQSPKTPEAWHRDDLLEDTPVGRERV